MGLVDLLLLLGLGKTILFEGLVQQLGADQFERRELATAVLCASGSSALPQLIRADRSPDPEVRRRVKEIIRLIAVRVFAETTEREVTIHANQLDNDMPRPEKTRGVVVRADGSKAFILTTPEFIGRATIVEWKGRKFFARYEKHRANPPVYLISIPYEMRLPLLKFPTGPTKGMWWDQHVEWPTSFKENMRVNDPAWNEMGAGIFSIDESDWRPVLVGILVLQREVVPKNRLFCSTLGASEIQVLLKEWGLMNSAKRRTRPLP